MKPLTEQLRGNAKSINLNDTARKAFSTVKELVTKATILAHQYTQAPISIAIDASDPAIRGVLQHWVNHSWQPLSFLSRRAQLLRSIASLDQSLLDILKIYQIYLPTSSLLTFDFTGWARFNYRKCSW